MKSGVTEEAIYNCNRVGIINAMINEMDKKCECSVSCKAVF